MSFVAELKRRNVFKVGAAYAVVAWIIIQVADTLLPTYGAPAWVMPVFTTVTMLGFPLALVLAWALEISPAGIRVTLDEETGRRSPAGFMLNFLIMGVMAVVIVWLVFDRSRILDGAASMAEGQAESPAAQAEAAAQQSASTGPARLPNSIAVLPFENLSPDPNNAYFAAGIHDTVLLELSKISDMNVIARTSVLPYSGTARPLASIAEELKVETIMEGSVQYAEGQVRITAQLIDPDTGSHIWSGNYDRPFADVFAIQSEIARNIASAIGSELLPAVLQSIGRQQTGSEEAYALYLQAKALTPNIAPFMDPMARAYLHEAIALDPAFAEAYAVLAFHYALSLGAPYPDLAMNEREALAADYAATAVRLNPDLGLGYGALAIVEGARFRTATEWEYWERAVALSPNDADVLDDAIRSFALKGRVERALELAARIQDINPEAMLTIQQWLALGTGEFSTYLGYLREQAGSIREGPVIQGFHFAVGANMEIALGNSEAAGRLLDAAEVLGVGPDMFFYSYLVYANGRLGRQDKARQLRDRWLQDFDGQFANSIYSALLSLAIADDAAALEALRSVAADPGPDKGIDTITYTILGNVFRDPVLDRPEFLEARRLFEARTQSARRQPR